MMQHTHAQQTKLRESMPQQQQQQGAEKQQMVDFNTLMHDARNSVCNVLAAAELLQWSLAESGQVLQEQDITLLPAIEEASNDLLAQLALITEHHEQQCCCRTK